MCIFCKNQDCDKANVGNYYIDIYCELVKEINVFPPSRSLCFYKCLNLESIQFFGNLKNLAISDCPKIRNIFLPLSLKGLTISGIIPNNFPISLKRINLDNIPKLTLDLSELIHLDELHLSRVLTLELIKLPPNLKTLRCQSCNIDKFPEFPSLKIFQCTYSPSLTEIPDLPDTLKIFNCSGCSSLKAIKYFPLFLSVLQCNNITIKDLPNLPTTLVWFSCSSNIFLKIPDLPDTLRTLDYSHCKNITEHPIFPSSLTDLNISGITHLPLPIFPVSLTELNCSNLHIKSITIPPDLNSLFLKNCPNITTIIGSFSNLLHLEISNNRLLTYFPPFTENIAQLYCSGCPWLNLNKVHETTRINRDENISPKDKSVYINNIYNLIKLQRNLKRTFWKRYLTKRFTLRKIVCYDMIEHIMTF